MAHLCRYLMTNLSSDVQYGGNDPPCVTVMTTEATTGMTTAALLSKSTAGDTQDKNRLQLDLALGKLLNVLLDTHNLKSH